MDIKLRSGLGDPAVVPADLVSEPVRAGGEPGQLNSDQFVTWQARAEESIVNAG